MGALEFWFDQESPKPVYRWNLRKAAGTRESEEYVIITLRALPGRTSTMQEPAKSDKLPDRIFYLLPEEGRCGLLRSTDVEC